MSMEFILGAVLGWIGVNLLFLYWAWKRSK
jgi:hypothetical protein